MAIGKDGPLGATRAVGSSGAGLRDRVAGLSEFDSAVAGAGGFTAGEAEAFASGGMKVREVVSCRRLRSACDVWSAAGSDFWVSQKRDPSGPSPAVSPAARLIAASKNSAAATWNPDNSRTHEREGEFSTRFADDSVLPVRICGPKTATEASPCAFIGRSSINDGALPSRISGVTISGGREPACAISSGEEGWSCSGITLPMALLRSSRTLRRRDSRQAPALNLPLPEIAFQTRSNLQSHCGPRR